MIVHDPILNVQAFGCSRQGASHKAAEHPVVCQDAHLLGSGSIAGKSYFLCAVADGHGSAKHDRSHIGSHIAVQVAASAFLDLLQAVSDASASQLTCQFKETFARNVVRTWRGMVLRHCERADQLESFPEDRKPTYTRYGSTLLFAGVVEGVLLFAQLGDGDIVFFEIDSNEAVPVFGEQENMVGGETYSLCSPDAEKIIRIDNRSLDQIRGIMLSTDGLHNAYPSDEEFHALLRAMLSNMQHYGAAKAAAIVPEHLDRFSENGSGDDMTLIGIHFRFRSDASKREDDDGNEIPETHAVVDENRLVTRTGFEEMAPGQQQ